jgi:murein L,D-transpeptidase YafK
VTIGCLPITDDGIKEVYWLAALARQSGQNRIPIWIFPARLTSERFQRLAEEHKKERALVAFWTNLREGFDCFENARQIPRISISPDGRYQFGTAKP